MTNLLFFMVVCRLNAQSQIITGSFDSKIHRYQSHERYTGVQQIEVKEADTSNTDIFSFVTSKYPNSGYEYVNNQKIPDRLHDQAIFRIIPSSASHCGRFKVWVDWNEDNDFDDQGEEVFSTGNFQSCNNPYEYHLVLLVPNNSRPGIKRLLIQVRDSWQGVPVSAGINGLTGTLDINLKIVTH